MRSQQGENRNEEPTRRNRLVEPRRRSPDTKSSKGETRNKEPKRRYCRDQANNTQQYITARCIKQER
jgi:hypothetical protein